MPTILRNMTFSRAITKHCTGLAALAVNATLDCKMFSRSQMIFSCIGSFLLGSITIGIYSEHRFINSLHVFSHLEMVEDITGGTHMVSLLQKGKYGPAEKFFSDELERNCEYYLSDSYNEGLDRENVKLRIMAAQEETGLCR